MDANQVTRGQPVSVRLRGLKLTQIGEAVKHISNNQYLIDGLVPLNGITLFVGPPGSFKSFLQASCAIHIAAGKDFFGLTITQCSVVVINAEGNEGYKKRMLAASEHYGISLDTIPLYVSNVATSLNTEEGIEELVLAIDSLPEPPGLIVIDTLSRSHEGDENSAKDINQVIRNLDLLKNKYNSAILLIHHTGKDTEKGARGSSALKAAVDAEFILRKKRDNELTVTNSKMKDDSATEILTFKLIEIGTYTPDQSAVISSAALERMEVNGCESKQHSIKLGKNEQKGLKTLKRLMEHNTVTDDQGYLSRNKVEISLSEWNTSCAFDSRQAFYRTKESLVNKGLVEIKNDLVYLIET